MKYNPLLHHRKSIRLKGYDYSQAGLYFITICCHNMKCLFGNIVNDEMELNDAGKIANECWLEIPQHFPNVVLHEHIIMPNHVHGIIEITEIKSVLTENLPTFPENNIANNDLNANDDMYANDVRAKNLSPFPDNNATNNDNSDDEIRTNDDTGNDNVDERAKDFSPRPRSNDSRNKNTPKKLSNMKLSTQFKSPSKTVGSIVRGFKTGVTNWFRKNRADDFPPGRTVWQRDFYEHIIRDEQAYLNISNYIINNPKNWKGDKFYK